MARAKENSLYNKVYQDILRMIREGSLAQGEKIPTERDLAERYAVSQITIKKATDMLVSDGYLRKHPGKGTFVVSTDASGEGHSEETYSANRNMVGVVLDHISDDFGTRTLIALETALGVDGYSLVVKFSESRMEAETASINKLLKLGVAGLAVKCAYAETYNDRILELSLQKYPMLFVDRYLPGLPVPYVGIDHRRACEELTDRMFQRGHRELLLVGSDNSLNMTSVKDRIQGYIDSCLRHSAENSGLNRLYLPGDFSMSVPPDQFDVELGRITQALENHPNLTGLVALSSGLGHMLCVAAHQLEQKTGRRVEVASFDAHIHHLEGFEPVLKLQQDETELGRRSAELLEDIIAGKPVERYTYTPYHIEEY